MFDRDALIALFHERALKFGEFTLVSGRSSSYYLDGKQITLHALGLRQVCEGLLELLADVEYDTVSGMSMADRTARTMSRARSRSLMSAEPPEWAQTFLLGQPMLMSQMSAPLS